MKEYLIRMESLIGERARNISEKCRKMKLQTVPRMSSVEVYNDLSISWCPIYKSNTRSWRKFIFKIDESLTEVIVIWFTIGFHRHLLIVRFSAVSLMTERVKCLNFKALIECNYEMIALHWYFNPSHVYVRWNLVMTNLEITICLKV